MASNSLGNILKLTTFGESHGDAIGGILDGFPAGLKVDFDQIYFEMVRRKPGQSAITTQRKETDVPVFLSGIFEGKTTGMPIAWQIKNENKKSKDYNHLKDTFRPNHADFTYQEKYGIRDFNGGGRSSARETANWVVAGALAKQFLAKSDIKVIAHVVSVGEKSLHENAPLNFTEIEKNLVRAANIDFANLAEDYLKEIKKQGNTVGGIIKGEVQNLPTGLGEPIFEKLHANLGKAFFSLNAVKGVEFGKGFEAAAMLGSQHNDVFELNEKGVSTKTNNSGGVQGGISNGMPLNFRLAFKPVATIMQDQPSINQKGETITLKGKGRHDPCVVPRAVPIVEALTSLVLVDHLLLQRTNRV